MFGLTPGDPHSPKKRHTLNSRDPVKHLHCSIGFGNQVTLANTNFFAWLLIRDRLSTRNLLRRKNMYLEDYNYVLCHNGPEETCFHLFFECPFSSDCWNSININWNFNLEPLDMIIQARIDFNSHIFREIFITTCWVLWKARNGIIFDNQTATLLEWRASLKEELGQICIKAKKSIYDLLFVWKENHL